MSVQPQKKDTQSAWFDIAVFAAVAAFFLFSAHSLVRSQGHSTNLTAIAPPIPDRSLASLQHETNPLAETEDKSVHVFKLDCLFGKPPVTLSTKAGMARIEARICKGPKPLPKNTEFAGKNDSSGEDIVLFVRDGSVMTTNYFSLREGKNQISFELALGKGQNLRQQLELSREPRD